LPGNVASIILAAAFVLLMAREERRHPLDRGKADATTTSKIASTRHAAANALFASLLRCQAAFAMFLA
jgi:hypothetical protein